MWKVLVTVGVISIVRLSLSAGFLKVEPSDDDEQYMTDNETKADTSDPPTWSKQASMFRRAFMDATRLPDRQNRRFDAIEDDTDDSLKQKISLLVQTTMRDTDYKMKFVNSMKERYKEDSKYKIGFVLVLVKKSRGVLNELFNVAVKNREQWKVLEQLKIFELILHTNVDITNLVKQLMKNHMEVKNGTDKATNSAPSSASRSLRMHAYDAPDDFNMMSTGDTPEQPIPPGPPLEPVRIIVEPPKPEIL